MVLKSVTGSSGRTRIISWEVISSGGMSFQGLSLGARLSLLMPAIIVVISLFIRTTVSLLSGFKGGLVDSLLMRLADMKSSFPGLLLTQA